MSNKINIVPKAGDRFTTRHGNRFEVEEVLPDRIIIMDIDHITWMEVPYVVLKSYCEDPEYGVVFEKAIFE